RPPAARAFDDDAIPSNCEPGIGPSLRRSSLAQSTPRSDAQLWPLAQTRPEVCRTWRWKDSSRASSFHRSALLARPPALLPGPYAADRSLPARESSRPAPPVVPAIRRGRRLSSRRSLPAPHANDRRAQKEPEDDAH